MAHREKRLSVARNGVKLALVLLYGGSWTAEEIMGSLGVSKPQANRYLAMLQDEFELVATVERGGVKRWELGDEHE